jgi:hypothetical protein
VGRRTPGEARKDGPVRDGGTSDELPSLKGVSGLASGSPPGGVSPLRLVSDCDLNSALREWDDDDGSCELADLVLFLQALKGSVTLDLRFRSRRVLGGPSGVFDEPLAKSLLRVNQLDRPSDGHKHNVACGGVPPLELPRNLPSRPPSRSNCACLPRVARRHWRRVFPCRASSRPAGLPPERCLARGVRQLVHGHLGCLVR